MWRWTVHRHDLDTLSLLAGLLYLGVGVAVLLGLVPGVGLPWRVLSPALLIAAGAAGLVASRHRLDPPTGGSDPKA
jgi:hypothetical protein